MILADAPLDSWEKVFSGQVGFIFATVLFGVFFWRAIMPWMDKKENATAEARAKETAALNNIADAVNKMTLLMEQQSKNGHQAILDKLAHMENK